MIECGLTPGSSKQFPFLSETDIVYMWGLNDLLRYYYRCWKKNKFHEKLKCLDH